MLSVERLGLLQSVFAEYRAHTFFFLRLSSPYFHIHAAHALASKARCPGEEPIQQFQLMGLANGLNLFAWPKGPTEN